MIKQAVNRVAKFFGYAPTRSQIVAMGAARQAVRLKARYDAAQTTSENAQHWLQADDLSAQGANTLAIRRTLRRRARYETANNCYAAGMLLTIANDLIGSGPRMQMTRDSGLSPKAKKQIEKAFAAWCRDVKLARKLRTAVVTKKRDGEVFCRFFSNPKHLTPAWLDLEILEGDQVTTPSLVQTEFKIDGITFDQNHQPDTYQILRQHPGDQVAMRTWIPDDVPADQVLHWFRVDRPGQLRGVPEITPGLPLFAMLRRYTLSVLTASETASDHAAVLYAKAAPGEQPDGDLSGANPYDDVPYTRGMLTAVPYGWELSQLRAEQPTTTYAMFKQEILNEIARCILVSYNIAAGNSSGYNYSSGRLDHKGYYGALAIEQSDLEIEWLDRIFRAWYAEARLITLPNGRRYVPDISEDTLINRCWKWAWDPPADIDPVKTATARQIDLACGATTLPEIWAEKGIEIEEAMEEQAEALGIDKVQFQELLRQQLYGAKIANQPVPDEVQARRKRGRTLGGIGSLMSRVRNARGKHASNSRT